MSEWIVIPNWDKFQHYSDRVPAWVKLYTELAHKDEWFQLSAAKRGLLVSCWLEYALAGGVLELTQLRRRSGLRARAGDLDSLQAAGFIEIRASRPRARARTRARERREEIEKKEPAEKSSKPKTEKAKARTWLGNTLHELEGVDVERVIQDEFPELGDQDVADLVAYTTERMKSI